MAMSRVVCLIPRAHTVNCVSQVKKQGEDLEENEGEMTEDQGEVRQHDKGDMNREEEEGASLTPSLYT